MNDQPDPAASDSLPGVSSAMSETAEAATPPAPGVMAEPVLPGGLPQLWSRYKIIVEVGGAVVTVITVLALARALLSYFVGSPELMLTVWFKETSVIYPSEATAGLELPLELNGEAVHAATMLTLRVSNTGSQVIGKQDETWTLNLVAPGAAKIRLMGEPSTKPLQGIVASSTQPNDNQVQLHLRAFESDSDLEFRLLVLNAPASQAHEVEVFPNLAGIPVEQTTLSPVARNGFKLFPVLFVILLPVIAIQIRRERRAMDLAKRAKSSWVAAVILLLFAAAMFSGLAAWFLGWVLTLFD